MTDPSYAALRAHDQRISRMLADPDCVGELLLVGSAMARSLDLHDPEWTETGSLPTATIAERVYGTRRLATTTLLDFRRVTADPNPYRRIRDVFRADRRRYDPDCDPGAVWFGHVLCGRPMVRRDGLCGRGASANHVRRLTDPATGLRQWVGACTSPACRAWLADLVSRNAAEMAANPAPEPTANTGGVLERHLPEIDWWKVWQAVDPKWTPPPEGRRFEPPTLTLLMGEQIPGDAKPNRSGPVQSRPALTVLEGGWR